MFGFRMLFGFTFFLLQSIWIEAIPFSGVRTNPPRDAVWETLIVTKTTIVCPETLGTSTLTRVETTTRVRSSTSAVTGILASRSTQTEKTEMFRSSGRNTTLVWSSIFLPTSLPTSFPRLSNVSTVYHTPRQSTSLSSPTRAFSQPTIVTNSTGRYIPPRYPISYSSPSLVASGISVPWSQYPTSSSSSSMGLFKSLFPWPKTSPSRKTPWKTTATSTPQPTRPSLKPSLPADNIFVPIQQDHILPQIPISQHHPRPRLGIEDDDKRTLQTNKFYANAFLGEQNQPVWTHPYMIWWGKNGKETGQFATWGMNVGHVESEDFIYGEGDPAKNFIAPRKQSLILSARELDDSTALTTDTHLPFSVNINLRQGAADGSRPKMTFPVVQGMSFVTASYQNASPIIQTGKDGFKDIGSPIAIGKSTKYRIKDYEGRDWVLYVNPVTGVSYDATKFTRLDNNTFILPGGFSGTIQVAKNPPDGDSESLYDKAHGTFVTGAQLTGTVTDTKGVYSFNYSKIGSAPLLLFLLPHHIQSLDPELRRNVTKLQLQTTTKGTATAVWGETMTFVEPSLPITMSFGPWTPPATSKLRYPPDFLALLATVAERDLRRAMSETIPQDSMYYAGKSLAKFATILWCIKEVLNNSSLANTGLDKLKAEMARYVQNRQTFSLHYDNSWKGVVSSAGFKDPNADFGNTYYNDHHFHFGYFVYAAAVIGSLDPGWLKEGDNKAWTNMLVKDFSESDYAGRDYPFQRCFDWWMGHSWAKGLFESADGKDQESTSEDGFAAFAVKMWGKVIGDVNMEKRGNLVLSIQSRSFNSYFYLASNNTVQPPRYIDNKVSGILFENKLDYATYFGAQDHLIHGIHMLPISPASAYLRPRAFVKEEWDRFFSGDRALVEGGWRGILFANLALVDARASYGFFRDGVEGTWDEGWIDGGASRTWYLVWSAALGGVR